MITLVVLLIPARAWITLATPSWAARFMARVTLVLAGSTLVLIPAMAWVALATPSLAARFLA